MPIETEETSFTRDAFGRYICNTMQEALESTRNGANPFHVVVIGGGTFGPALASALFNIDKPTFTYKGDRPDGNDPFGHYNNRILVLDAGPFLIPEHGPKSATDESVQPSVGNFSRSEAYQ